MNGRTKSINKMLLRAGALSTLVLISVALLLPLSVSLAHWAHSSATKKHLKGRHHHSKAWWRRHHARLRRIREAHNSRNLSGKPRVQPPFETIAGANTNYSGLAGRYGRQKGLNALSSQLPSAEARQWRLNVPATWDGTDAMAARQVRFSGVTSNGKEAGQAAFSLAPAFAHAAGRSFGRDLRHTMAGVSFAELRRIAIDQMIGNGGWVINDLEKNFGNRRTFVVLAQSGSSPERNGVDEAWAFYFTEANGRIYCLTTSAPLEFSERMSAESAKLLASFHSTQ